MPIAWVTFWKSTWGTRMTPSDVKEKERKQRRKKHAATPETTETPTDTADKAKEGSDV